MSPTLGGSDTQTEGASSMTESIESIAAIMMAMNKEQKAQNELMMQRISVIEEQLRDSASKDDVREILGALEGRVNT